MRKLIPLLAIFIVCSEDNGLTRYVFANANHIFYSEGCIVFNAYKQDGPFAVCSLKAQCVVEEGTIPPAGSDLRKPESK